LGLPRAQPLIGMSHHANHAAFSFAASPFNRSAEPVMVTVLDGFGDAGAISLYVADQGRLRCIWNNDSFFDSLGVFYSIISSTQGGWTTLSSEGRYMGAAAWGDRNRLTNPYYRRLRQIFYFGAEGRVYVNRALVNWHNGGERKPYNRALQELLGEPIPPEKMWNPDAVLRVDDVAHSAATRERVDLAAATQLVFEDALFHIVEHLIRSTRSDRLVLTGGTALNCVANMLLLEHFDRDWYRRNLGRETRLHIWVPPAPGDAGVTAGAAYSFALQAGARPGEALQHAFYCGRSASRDAIVNALHATSEIGYRRLGDVQTQAALDEAADFAAYLVARDSVLGFYQGPAETGPRALGHRSIVANPCNPRTLENINRRVKFREPIRPLAPLATLEAAQHFFELSPGAADDQYNAYNYMVLTARARPAAYQQIPAVVHHDGTARVQIVRREHDPFTYAYLKALGRHLNVEVSVNTSLNVGSPIVQTPEQALAALKRAKALTALILVAAEGDVFLAWHAVDEPPKDGGRQLLHWYAAWRQQRSEDAPPDRSLCLRGDAVG
jgi:carbamoyltransferase